MNKSKIFFSIMALLLLATFITTLQRYDKSIKLKKEIPKNNSSIKTDSEKTSAKTQEQIPNNIYPTNTNSITAKELLQSQRNAILIDLRNYASYKEAHIKGSIPITKFPDDYDKTKHIVLITDNKVSNSDTQTILSAFSQESTVKIYSDDLRTFDERGGNVILQNNIDDLVDLSKVTFINLKEAKKITQEDDELTIIDVRRIGNFENSHINKAINIPYLELEQRYSELPIFSKKIFVYGANKKQSFLAGALLSDLGIFGVKVLDGGYEDLKNFKSEKDITFDEVDKKNSTK